MDVEFFLDMPAPPPHTGTRTFPQVDRSRRAYYVDRPVIEACNTPAEHPTPDLGSYIVPGVDFIVRGERLMPPVDLPGAEVTAAIGEVPLTVRDQSTPERLALGRPEDPPDRQLRRGTTPRAPHRPPARTR